MKITEVYDVISCVIYKSGKVCLTAEDECLIKCLRLEKGGNAGKLCENFP